MDGEPTLQQSGEKLVTTVMSLDKMLGAGWKDKSTFPSVDVALSNEGIKSLQDGQEVETEHDPSKLGRFITGVNKMFDDNGVGYHARRITDEKGGDKALIIGKIGEDETYQVVKTFFETESGGR